MASPSPSQLVLNQDPPREERDYYTRTTSGYDLGDVMISTDPMWLGSIYLKINITTLTLPNTYVVRIWDTNDDSGTPGNGDYMQPDSAVMEQGAGTNYYWEPPVSRVEQYEAICAKEMIRLSFNLGYRFNYGMRVQLIDLSTGLVAVNDVTPANGVMHLACKYMV